jgi:lysophospholipase L1-like esterase
VIDGLKAKYPAATINQTLAYKGGMEAADAAAQTLFNDKILNATNKPDLVVIALGMNDDDTAAFKTAINNFISQAQAKGIEVLLVSTMQSNPFVEPLINEPTRAEIAQATRDIAASRNVALADVWTEWQNQAFLGIPPWSQLHNWSNHPGVPGHQLYANTILRFF